MSLNQRNSSHCFSELPDSLLEIIFSFLSLSDIANCLRVCKVSEIIKKSINFHLKKILNFSHGIGT